MAARRRCAAVALMATVQTAPALAATAEWDLDAAQAVPEAALLESMGINTHFSFADTPYAARYDAVKTKLVALGLHHIRDVLTPHAVDLAHAGITSTILLEPNTASPQAAQARVKALNARGVVVDAVEGANEPDMFWRRLGITYHGQGYPAGAAAYQRDLYRAFKSDSATSRLPVIGVSLGLAGMANAPPQPALFGLRAAVDWGDVHPYPYNGNPFAPVRQYGGLDSFYRHGTFPSVYLGDWPDALRAYTKIYGPGPMAATETGYPTGPHFTSESLQARYVPRLFAEFFRLGFRRTYLYQFLDSVTDPSGRDPDASFGLLRNDLSPRPSYASLRLFAHLLAANGGPGGTLPRGVRLHLSVTGTGDFSDATRVHHLLLSRPDGTWLLLLWNEVSGEDAASDPRRAIDVPPMRATLSAPVSIIVKLGTMDAAARPLEPARAAAGQAVPLAVPDAVLAVEIATASATP